VPVLIEVLERHDDHTIGRAVDAAEKLTGDLKLWTSEVEFAIRTCHSRAREKLASLELAFEPIRDRAVPERLTLQMRIQEYKQLMGTLERIQRRHAEAPPRAASNGAPRAAIATPSKTGGGARRGFLAIPIALAVVAVVVWKALGGTHGTPAATPAGPASSAAPSASLATAPPAAAPAPSAAHTQGKPGKPHASK
jgi:hypothetical protein